MLMDHPVGFKPNRFSFAMNPARAK
jgi:hypothetical protein